MLSDLLFVIWWCPCCAIGDAPAVTVFVQVNGKAAVVEDTGWETTGLDVLSTEDMKNLSLKNGWIQP